MSHYVSFKAMAPYMASSVMDSYPGTFVEKPFLSKLKPWNSRSEGRMLVEAEETHRDGSRCHSMPNHVDSRRCENA